MSKPRILIDYGQWKCFTRRGRVGAWLWTVGYGDNPADAYADWQRKEAWAGWTE